MNKVKNSREFVSTEQKEQIMKTAKLDKECFFLYIDGKQIYEDIQYFAYLYKYMKLPLSFCWNLDAYLDMMRDPFSYDTECLSEKGNIGNNHFTDEDFDKQKLKKIVFLIDNYQLFLRKQLNFKIDIEEMFDETILPFFEDEVIRTVVGGYPIQYNVYCCITDLK